MDNALQLFRKRWKKKVKHLSFDELVKLYNELPEIGIPFDEVEQEIERRTK